MKGSRWLALGIGLALVACCASVSFAAFVDNGNGTVTDTSTGLMWQQDTARDDQGNYDPMTWEEALAYCESRPLGGHTDWRLPTIKELRSLVDYTQYGPAIDKVRFPNTVSSYYWSSTTYAYSTDSAWYVHFYYGYDYWYYKSYNYYVRAVRGGQSGSFGNLDHFVISNTSGGDIPAQVVGAWFSVLIKAVDASGNTVTSFNGEVSLSTPGGIYPISARLGSGQGTVSAKLYSGGTTRINCSGYGAYGNSNYFSVTGGSACSGKIFGRVVDAKGSALYQADVKIYNAQGQLVTQKQTDASGNFSFSGLACGTYEIQALKNGKGRTISGIAVTSTMAQRLDDIQVPVNVGTGVIPVVYVAGMMGSSIGKVSPYPKLPAEDPARGLHIHLDDITGYKKLKKALEEDTGYKFKVFPCPWDWRHNFEEAYRWYLKPKITEALQECGSATGKVYIVAHSMGGLVVRAYIQSNKDDDYRGDIDKFAMVGTPHLGSSNPYYIWEGGDPKGADDILDEGVLQFTNAYSNTLQNLWEETYKKKGWSNKKHDDIRDFVRDKAKSLLDLMNTGTFLFDWHQLWGVETQGNVNTRLKDLNSGSGNFYGPSDVMNKDGSNGKVEVRLFVGNENVSTIQKIYALEKDGPNSKNARYQDGIPKSESPKRANVSWSTGDGTVPYESATLPVTAGWAKLGATTTKKEHFKLVGAFVEEIKAFLLEGESTGAWDMESYLEGQEGDVAAAQFSVSVAGNMRTAVRDSAARQTGIDPSTGNPVEQIPNSGCAFGAEGGWVGIEGPSAGAYQVTYFGEAQRDFHLDIGWVDDTTTESYSFRGFRPAAATTFSVAVNPTGTPRITVTPPAKAPTNLQADPYTSGTEKTRLTWTATGESGLTGYNIYAVAELEPYFTKVTTVGAGTTSYDTADAWSSSSATTVKTYAVAAVKTGGIESFFSNLAQNNDRDHDGLTDVEEDGLGTDKTKADTDGDGLKDGDEQAYGTNPLVKDTDGDGYNDYAEIQGGSDPLDPASVPATTRYVEPAGACGTKTPCYTTLQAALNAAADGDTIQAAKTLTPADPVWGKTGTVTISGGWKPDFSGQDGTTSMYAPRATGGGGVKVQPNVKIIPKP